MCNFDQNAPLEKTSGGVMSTYAGRRGEGVKTVITVVVGTAAWAVFAFWLHGAWIGVQPFA